MKVLYSLETGVARIKNKTLQATNRMVVGTAVVLGVAGIMLAPVASAASSSTTVTPSSAGVGVYGSNNVVGVEGDSAPGFPTGSLASNGLDKTDMYFTPAALFGHSVNLGDVQSMSYWTKKSTDHVSNPADWFINIYTDPYTGDVSSSSWYGDRIGTEPYFAKNLNEQVGGWNNWTTNGAQNQLRFFESTAGASGATFGSYTDPVWDDFVAGNALSGSPYADHSVLYFSVQTGSAWAAGFTGQVDGLTITLKNGEVAKVNFEADKVVATSKDQCKGDGWKTVFDNSGTAFKNQGDCVSFVATHGKNKANG